MHVCNAIPGCGFIAMTYLEYKKQSLKTPSAKSVRELKHGASSERNSCDKLSVLHEK